jgi:hypothetical protein
MRIFTDHPRSIGMGYWRHMHRALVCGALMIGAGLACLVHAIFPMVFTETASRILDRLNCHMKK